MEITNTKFNTTKKFVTYNREKDRLFLRKIALLGGLLTIGFLIGRKAVG